MKQIKPLSLAAAAALVVTLGAYPMSALADVPPHVQRTGQRFSTTYGFPTFNWCGHDWAVRQTEGVIDWGGPQAEDPADNRSKWVNGAQVLPNGDLKIRNDGIRGGVEINVVESTGYGTYIFEYSADFNDMDPHNVLGIFPYDMAEMELNKVSEVHKNGRGSTEIDFIEISRWGQLTRPLPHGGVTYYPDTLWGPSRYNIDEFDIPAGEVTLQTIAEWEKDYLRVVTKTKEGEVLSDVTSTTRIPKDTGTQQLRINLWTTGANKSYIAGKKAYQHADGDEITFHDFSYSPEIGVAANQAVTGKPITQPPAPQPQAPQSPVPPPAVPQPRIAQPSPSAPATPADRGAVPPASVPAFAPGPVPNPSQVAAPTSAAAPAPASAPVSHPAPASASSPLPVSAPEATHADAHDNVPPIAPESDLFDPATQPVVDRDEDVKAAEDGKDRKPSGRKPGEGTYFSWLFADLRSYFNAISNLFIRFSRM